MRTSVISSEASYIRHMASTSIFRNGDSPPSIRYIRAREN